jgi:indolepyruvate ferredoxin oxidoreductase beta subunit
METTNVLIVGVGGQGIILASEILSGVAMAEGMDVKKSEVHGMAQRGGVVTSHVRFGLEVFSPLIPHGTADVILAYESAEGLRWCHELKPGGTIIVNSQRIIPPTASSKEYDYPADALAQIRSLGVNMIEVDAAGICEEIGNPKLGSTVLLGTLSTQLSIPESAWLEVIQRRVPKGTEELNVTAFHRGKEADIKVPS